MERGANGDSWQGSNVVEGWAGVSNTHEVAVGKRTLDQLRPLLEARESLYYVFVAQTNLNLRTFLLSMLARGASGLTGEVLVVITDKSLVLVGTDTGWFRALRPTGIINRLPHPPQL